MNIPTQPPETRDPRPETLLLGAILLFGLALRLYHVTAPPIDFLSWRDTQTLMLARNFYREGMNLFSPSVDWRTTAQFAPKGTVGGTELPVVPYLTAALYFVFGIQYWVGRVVPIAFALLGTFCFFRLVRRFYGVPCAALSALLLTVSPYYLYCGRVQMPEAFAFAMSFAALEAFDRWLMDNRRAAFWQAAAFTALTLLGKPQLGIIAVPMAFLCFQRFGARAFTLPRLYAFAAIVAAPVLAYIGYSYKVLIPVAGLSFAGASLFDHQQHLLSHQYYLQIARAIWDVALTPPIVFLAFLGLFVRGADRRAWFVHAWLIGAVAFFFIMPGGNITNGYYHLVLAPPAVILASRALAAGLSRRRLRFIAAIVLAVAVGFGLYTAKGFYRPYYASALHCGTWINEHTPKDTRVLSADRSPAALYFADKTGWIAWRDAISTDFINKVIPQGADILAISDIRFDDAYDPRYQDIRDDLYDTYLCHHGQDFAVFSLRNPADLTLPQDGRVVFGTPDARKYLRGTWGPNQDSASRGAFVAMGPAKRSAITFASAQPPKRLELTLSSAVQDQELSIQLNGQPAATLRLARAFDKGGLVIESFPPAPPDNRWTLTLDAAKQNPNAASVLIYSLVVHAN